jgi:tRNA(Ile)-lysidine synthetase-like protein
VVVRDARGSLHATEPEATRSEPATLELELKGRGGACVFAGVEIRWQRGVGRGIQGRGAARPGLERFDAAKVGDRVRLRHWRPGDRFQPIGMPAPVKLQDLFVNAGIERERRRQLVVAATAAGELFWVEGLRMAEGFKLDKESRHRLKWQWLRSAPDGQRLVASGLTP